MDASLPCLSYLSPNADFTDLQSYQLTIFIVGSKFMHESEYLSRKLHCTTGMTFSGHCVPVHCGISRTYTLDTRRSAYISEISSIYVITTGTKNVTQTNLLCLAIEVA